MNLKPLLINRTGFYISDIYDYLQLVSWRSHFDYQVKGIITLPVTVAKANSVDLNNPLIKVINKDIHFKYETDENRGVR